MVFDSRRNATSSKNISKVARDSDGTLQDDSHVRFLRGLDKIPKSIDALTRFEVLEFVRVTRDDDRVVNFVIELLHLENPHELSVKCPFKLDRAAHKSNHTIDKLFNGRGGVCRKLFRRLTPEHEL